MILVVEDDPVNAALAERQLAKLGRSARLARSGREAIEALGRESYAMILMDCQMPEMDGYETTRSIRSEGGVGAEIPIVAMTAYTTDEDREACFAAGMDDYIAKPVRIEDLQAVLSRWLGDAATAVAAHPPGEAREGPIAIERLIEEMEGSDGLDRLVELYLGRLPDRRAAIRQAIEGGDSGALRSAAHALKGPSAIFGAEELVRRCKELEDLGRSGTTEGAEALAEQVEGEAERVKAALEELD